MPDFVLELFLLAIERAAPTLRFDNGQSVLKALEILALFLGQDERWLVREQKRVGHMRAPFGGGVWLDEDEIAPTNSRKERVDEVLLGDCFGRRRQHSQALE